MTSRPQRPHHRSVLAGGGASRHVLVGLVALCAVVALVAGGCGGSDLGGSDARDRNTSGSIETTTDEPSAATTAPRAGGPAALMDAVCDGSAKVTDAGTITSPDITEASGIVASWGTADNGAGTADNGAGSDNGAGTANNGAGSGGKPSGDGNPGPWWVHNDSGDSARVFALDGSGRLLATVALDGATARDWEDIAAGPPATPNGRPQLYVGDIGNNAAMRSPSGARRSVRIYRFDEPVSPTTPAPDGNSGPIIHTKAAAFTLTYPDGAHDAEALLVDPIAGDLLLVTKDWAHTGESQVYRVPGAARIAAGSTTVMERVGSVPMGPGQLVTAADVTHDGSLVALRSYGGVSLYRRPKGEQLWAAFATEPCAGPRVSELQGEAIGFAPDGGSYLTVAEGSSPTLHRTSP